MTHKPATILLAALLALAPPALARPPAAAHQHGVATLGVAIEGDRLHVVLTAPLDTLVGFEHEPRTATQREALARAQARLEDFGVLFRLPTAAGCRVDGVDLSSPWALASGRGAATARRDGHAELSAEYRLSCQAPEALDLLELKLFEVFPRAREVRAERVSPRGQSAARLTPKQRALSL